MLSFLVNIRKILHFLNSVFFAEFSHYFLLNVNIIFFQIFSFLRHFLIFAFFVSERITKKCENFREKWKIYAIRLISFSLEILLPVNGYVIFLGQNVFERHTRSVSSQGPNVQTGNNAFKNQEQLLSTIFVPSTFPN